MGKSVADGKTSVANAISAKGVPTATDATFSTMANNIGKIESIQSTKTETISVSKYFSGSERDGSSWSSSNSATTLSEIYGITSVSYSSSYHRTAILKSVSFSGKTITCSGTFGDQGGDDRTIYYYVTCIGK